MVVPYPPKGTGSFATKFAELVKVGSGLSEAPALARMTYELVSWHGLVRILRFTPVLETFEDDD